MPGSASLHNCMSGHGPDAAAYQRGRDTELKPHVSRQHAGLPVRDAASGPADEVRARNRSARARLLHALAGAEEAVLADGGWMTRPSRTGCRAGVWRAAGARGRLLDGRRGGAGEMRSRVSRGHRRAVPRRAGGEGPEEALRREQRQIHRERAAAAARRRLLELRHRPRHVQAARDRPDRGSGRHLLDDARGGEPDDHRGAPQDRRESAAHRDRDARRAQRERRQEPRDARSAARRVLRVRRRRPIASRERNWSASPTCISAACS